MEESEGNRLDDLVMSTGRNRELQTETDKLLDQARNIGIESMEEFTQLMQECENPAKEGILSLTERAFRIFGFEIKSIDAANQQLQVSQTREKGIFNITFQIDKKTEQMTLTSHIGFSQSQLINSATVIDINNPFSRDILSFLCNSLSTKLSYLSIEYGTRFRSFQCQTSMIGQLDDNFLCWLLLNTDVLLIANFQLVHSFQLIKQNQSVDASILAIKYSESVYNKIVQNRYKFEQLFSLITEHQS